MSRRCQLYDQVLSTLRQRCEPDQDTGRCIASSSGKNGRSYSPAWCTTRRTASRDRVRGHRLRCLARRRAGHDGMMEVSDQSNPTRVTQWKWSPPFGGGTYNCLPLPDEADYVSKGAQFGPHNRYENQPNRIVSDQTIFATQQNARVHVFNISDTYCSEEIAAFMPPAPRRLVDHRPNRPLAIWNYDIFVPHVGLVYSSDYNGGLYIIEYGAEVNACPLWTRVRNKDDQRSL